MKTIKEWTNDHLEREGHLREEETPLLIRQVRDEALGAAESVARRDGHNETADKIAALRSLP